MEVRRADGPSRTGGLTERHDARLTVMIVEREIDTGSLDTVGLDRAEAALQSREDRKGEERIANRSPTSTSTRSR